MKFSSREILLAILLKITKISECNRRVKTLNFTFNFPDWISSSGRIRVVVEWFEYRVKESRDTEVKDAPVVGRRSSYFHIVPVLEGHKSYWDAAAVFA